MKKKLDKLIRATLKKTQYGDIFLNFLEHDLYLERTRDQKFGDFSSNIALRVSKKINKPPLDLANEIVELIPKNDLLDKITVEGPGFINFYLSELAYHQEIEKIINQKNKYGESNIGENINIIVEYVSANPTGPLHVGHGRHAAYGASVANMLKTTGHEVFQEYYINDAGRQMDILTISVFLRYLEINNINLTFPKKAYQGDYVINIAKKIKEKYKSSLTQSCEDFISNIQTFVGDEEKLLDKIILDMNKLIGPNVFINIKDLALGIVIKDIKSDLEEFGVKFDRWYSEKELTENKILETIKTLEKNNYIYTDKDAKWFKSSVLGDEKDRVLIKSNGSKTYFASDIAYHLEKIQRGFKSLINIFGADHHGYTPRILAGIEALNHKKEIIEFNIVQFVALFRGKKKTQMSTRSGNYVTLRELRKEVGNDAARFFYIFRSNDQHLNFDLELAKTQSNDNPVYYIQYAHARISSLLKQTKINPIDIDERYLSNLSTLSELSEKNLFVMASKYPEIIESASANRAPHQLAHYLRDLAAAFHTFYNSERILSNDESIKKSRIVLSVAIKIILKNGLSILGVSAPESM